MSNRSEVLRVVASNDGQFGSPHDTALEFIRRHQGAHLERDLDKLIQRTAACVESVWYISASESMDVAIRAYSEIKSSKSGYYVDFDKSSSYCLFIRSSNGHPVLAFSIDELIKATEHLQRVRV